MTRITGTLHVDSYTFLIIPRLVLLRIKNVSVKFEKKIIIRILFLIKSSFLYPLYEIKWKNTVGPNSLHLTIQRMRIACWIVTAINKRFRWSRGNVPAFGTQVRGFAPGQFRRIFRAKNSSARLPSEGK
jgi:hypothetical protein